MGPSPPTPLFALAAPPFPGQTRTVEIGEGAGAAALDRFEASPGPLTAVPAPAGRLARARAVPTVGVAVRVTRLVRLPAGVRRVTLQGLHRVRVHAAQREEDGFIARVEPLADVLERSGDALGAGAAELGGAALEVRRLLEALAVRGSAGRGGPREAEDLVALVQLNAPRPEDLVDFVAPLLVLPPGEVRGLLLEEDERRRLGLLGELIARELEEEARLEERAEERLHKGYLREKIAALRAELGEESPRERESEALAAAIAAAPFAPAVRERAEHELARFRRSALGSVESSQVRNALEWMLELPWAPPRPPADPDPAAFERVTADLERSHIGLAEVKERVLEFLAVRQLRRGGRGTALCFVGPPGTGKSSMGRAVARALGREFVHVPVGSITTESELRGVPALQEGAGPGAILEGLRRAGTPNPVVLLDEIDQLELGGSGTAGGALLEILDPEANGAFLDLYLGVPYDLSRCIFLATANDLSGVSEGLVDRLEVIPFFGYTEAEKLAIARTHLLPQVRRSAGLERGQLKLSPAALRTIVRGYTEEAGVRMLRRHLDALARKAAVSVVREGAPLQVVKGDLLALLGPSIAERDPGRSRPAVGLSTGLAWTSAGGTLLPIEAVATPGSGRVTLTGHIGDVMRESVQACLTYVRTLFGELGIAPDALDTLDLHLHFPGGAIPKEGPSAGVAVAIAVFSLLTGTPVRHDVAMTGEISLHGEVLPVGGLREKLLAALRAGITEVVLPARNEEDLQRLPAELRAGLTLHLIGRVRDAFGLALAAPRSRPRRLGGASSGRRVARRSGGGRRGTGERRAG